VQPSVTLPVGGVTVLERSRDDRVRARARARRDGQLCAITRLRNPEARFRPIGPDALLRLIVRIILKITQRGGGPPLSVPPPPTHHPHTPRKLGSLSGTP
jgi:hypothetical protein